MLKDFLQIESTKFYKIFELGLTHPSEVLVKMRKS